MDPAVEADSDEHHEPTAEFEETLDESNSEDEEDGESTASTRESTYMDDIDKKPLYAGLSLTVAVSMVLILTQIFWHCIN